MSKTMKVLYYVDMDDNTKSAFAVVDGSKNLRDNKTINSITEQLEIAGFGDKPTCNNIAVDLVYNGDAEVVCQMGRYEFGIEDAPLI